MALSIHNLGIHWQVHTIRCQKGTPIRFACYKKEEEPEQYLIFFNGRGEWIEKYAHLPKILGLPPHCGFITLDWRGQGASGGQRGDIESYDHYLEDLLCILPKATHGQPYSIVSHSMGALIGLYGTAKGLLTPRSLVLCSPLFGFIQSIPKPLLETFLKATTLTPLAPISCGVETAGGESFANNPYTHDSQSFEAIVNAPYRVPAPSFRWVYETLRAQNFVFGESQIKDLKTNTLLIAGSDERVVDPKAFRKWIDLASSLTPEKISYRLISGARHEVLNEIALYHKPATGAIRYFMKEIWPKRPDLTL